MTSQTALSAVDRLLERAERVLVASDFDGTLCAIAHTPAGAALSPGMFALLEQFAASPAATLAVVSGRGLYDLAARVPAGLILAGNHGLEIEGRGLDFVHPEAREYRPHLAAACGVLREELLSWPGAWLEDKTLTATVHYRNADPRTHHALLFAVRRALAHFGPVLALRCGKKALEVRPKVAWNKGSAVAWIRERTGPHDACICLGDDSTDEDMFADDSRQVNIRVGCRGRSAARHQVADPMDVALVLSRVLQAAGERPVATSRLFASG